MRNITRIVKNVFSLRQKSHLATRLALREERVFFRRTLPYSIPVYLSFSVLDYIVTNGRSIFFFLALRLLAVSLSVGSFLLMRGRTRYAVRAFFSTLPVAGIVQYIMITENLTMSPYYSGMVLVLVATLLQFQLRFKLAFVVTILLVSPTLIWYTLNFPETWQTYSLIIVMTIGCAIISMIFSDELSDEVRHRFKAQEHIARESGQRQSIIQKQVGELLRRRILEYQFSPQIIKALFDNENWSSGMQMKVINIVVIDIENSTKKSKQLNSDQYKHVVEEVFDVFSSACLKWDVTIDKFTGDGAQAFSGAPISTTNDLTRAISACIDTIRMLRARSKELTKYWEGEVKIRTSIVSGEALVGFIGKGRLKSFTAIGENVSLAHRICNAVEPWCIGLYAPAYNNVNYGLSGVSDHELTLNNLKGFEGTGFKIKQLEIDYFEGLEPDTLGRCDKCSTPLVISSNEMGIYEIVCPACGQSESSSNTPKAA